MADRCRRPARRTQTTAGAAASARGMDRHSTPSDIRFALPIPPECVRRHKPRIIELPGVAEGEAAFLMREQEDQGSGGAEKDQSGDCHAMSPASARAFP